MAQWVKLKTMWVNLDHLRVVTVDQTSGSVVLRDAVTDKVTYLDDQDSATVQLALGQVAFQSGADFPRKSPTPGQ